jgi:hypothetical protein
MDRRPVRSSNVASVGYDESSSTLEVEFHGGRVYRYFGVPEQHFVALTAGVGSVWKYLNRNVKGIYRYRQVG